MRSPARTCGCAMPTGARPGRGACRPPAPRSLCPAPLSAPPAKRHHRSTASRSSAPIAGVACRPTAVLREGRGAWYAAGEVVGGPADGWLRAWSRPRPVNRSDGADRRCRRSSFRERVAAARGGSVPHHASTRAARPGSPPCPGTRPRWRPDRPGYQRPVSMRSAPCPIHPWGAACPPSVHPGTTGLPGRSALRRERRGRPPCLVRRLHRRDRFLPCGPCPVRREGWHGAAQLGRSPVRVSRAGPAAFPEAR